MGRNVSTCQHLKSVDFLIASSAHSFSTGHLCLCPGHIPIPSFVLHFRQENAPARKPMKLKSALFRLAALGGLAAAGTASAMPLVPLSPASNVEKAAAVCGPNGCVRTAPVLYVRPHPNYTRIVHDGRCRSVRAGCLRIGYDPLPYRFGSSSVRARPVRFFCRW
jgi:hypothetical protein